MNSTGDDGVGGKAHQQNLEGTIGGRESHSTGGHVRDVNVGRKRIEKPLTEIMAGTGRRVGSFKPSVRPKHVIRCCSAQPRSPTILELKRLPTCTETESTIEECQCTAQRPQTKA